MVRPLMIASNRLTRASRSPQCSKARISPHRCRIHGARLPAREMWPHRGVSREPSAIETVVATVRGWITEAERVVVLTGAGISTDSGIPDFRGPQGVWTRNPEAEKMATLQNYLADPEVRKRSWRSRLDS